MERIASLIEQLQTALQQKADPAHLLMLTNRLQAELGALTQPSTESFSTKRVAVVLPLAGGIGSREVNAATPEKIELPVPEPEKTPEKIVEVLQVDEQELEAELEEIRQKAEYAKKMQAKQNLQKPPLLFEEEHLIPTLIHQPGYVEHQHQHGSKEVNESVQHEVKSLNELLREDKTEIGHKLTESSAIKDLKKAIGINDRFVFINELFRGDEVMYERSIKTINNFSIYPEAQYWMERELKIKLGWDDNRPASKEFYALVKRRFS